MFALMNGLAASGKLSDDEHAKWKTDNAWFNAAYPIPDSSHYDRLANPGAVSWFRSDASALLERVNDYLRILEAHGVPIEIARTDDPGRIVYSDAFQVVACPIPNGHRS